MSNFNLRLRTKLGQEKVLAYSNVEKITKSFVDLLKNGCSEGSCKVAVIQGKKGAITPKDVLKASEKLDAGFTLEVGKNSISSELVELEFFSDFEVLSKKKDDYVYIVDINTYTQEMLDEINDELEEENPSQYVPIEHPQYDCPFTAEPFKKYNEDEQDKITCIFYKV